METVIGTDVHKAQQFLEANAVVAIPTETVYGLAGNALSPEAISTIYEVKQRPRFNPLILHVAVPAAIEKYAVLTSRQMECAQKLMPGPFTLLLPRKPVVPDLLTAGSEKVAVRVPAHPLAIELLAALRFPLAAPSANPFGYISPTTAQHVYENLNGKIPYILDGGTCQVGVESTIAEFSGEKLLIHRLGGTPVEAIRELTGLPVEMAPQGHRPQTSGQLKSHYAPSTPLFMGEVEKLLEEHRGKKLAVISFRKRYAAAGAESFPLSEAGDLTEAAGRLFAVLRSLDHQRYDAILAEVFPAEGLGAAINDRLGRAQFIHKEQP